MTRPASPRGPGERLFAFASPAFTFVVAFSTGVELSSLPVLLLASRALSVRGSRV
ncbi:MAG TPA: hypothetical protein VMH79_15930 [Thermoanaerobaculia bacterium]|nr:hypothetical protein [Thermoanaerobaculia bacterium]